MKTGYLHIDGNDALGRTPARPHHWLVALAAVMLAQWVMWQGASLGQYAGFLWASGTSDSPTSSFAVSTIFYLAVPTALVATLTLYVSARFDGRGARSIGLAPKAILLAFVWAFLGLIAAVPHMIALAVRGPLGEGWISGAATLAPVTIIQAGSEEILFRGVILGFLCARYGARVGVLISALLFGFWHVYIGQPLIDAAIMFATSALFGMTAAVLTLHYASIGPALGLHVVWNVAGYMSSTAGHSPFWDAWVAYINAPWTIESVMSGEVARMLLIPLAIETLLILAVCRPTVLRLVGAPQTSHTTDL